MFSNHSFSGFRCLPVHSSEALPCYACLEKLVWRLKDSIVIDQRCGLQASSYCLCEQRVVKAKQVEQRWLWLECLGTELSYCWKASDRWGSLGTNSRADCPKAPLLPTQWGREDEKDELLTFFKVLKTLFRLNDIYESLFFPVFKNSSHRQSGGYSTFLKPSNRL